MKTSTLFVSILIFLITITSVYSFSIEDINQSMDSFNIDLQGDKVDYRFSKQDKIKKNLNGDFINIETNDFIDSKDNLNLDTIQDVDVEDNSEQGESKEEYGGSVIPINYFENKQEDIEKNIIRKKNSFQLEYYEDGVIKAKQGLQRYYNPDLKNVLIGGVPSTFGFGNGSVGSSSDTLGVDLGQSDGGATSNNCAATCNCGNFYNFLGQCKTVPANGYSTGNNFKCNTGYKKQGNKCVYDGANTTVPITDSPYSGIKYNGIQIESGDDPFGVKVKTNNSSNSNTNLGIHNAPYAYTPASFEYTPIINTGTTCGYASYTSPTYCVINNNSSIYDIPGQ